MKRLVSLFLVLLLASSAAAQTPQQIAYASERTVWIDGGCSGVLIKHQGNYLVASATHCMKGGHSKRTATRTYPTRIELELQEVHHLGRYGGFGTWQPEILLLEVIDPPADLPYAEIGPVPTAGQISFTTAYPVRPVVAPSVGLKYASASVKAVGNGGVIFSSQIWGGNSGGPLWNLDGDPKVIGIASATTRSDSKFSSSQHLRDALTQLFGKKRCPD